MPSALASAGLAKVTGAASNQIRPELGSSEPERILIRVDLPAPLSPSRPTTSPGRTSKPTSSSATTGPKRLVRASTRSSDAVPCGSSSCAWPPSGWFMSRGSPSEDRAQQIMPARTLSSRPPRAPQPRAGGSPRWPQGRWRPLARPLLGSAREASAVWVTLCGGRFRPAAFLRAGAGPLVTRLNGAFGLGDMPACRADLAGERSGTALGCRTVPGPGGTARAGPHTDSHARLDPSIGSQGRRRLESGSSGPRQWQGVTRRRISRGPRLGGHHRWCHFRASVTNWRYIRRSPTIASGGAQLGPSRGEGGVPGCCMRSGIYGRRCPIAEGSIAEGRPAMATRLQDKKADLLGRVVDRLHDKLDDNLAALAEAFVQHYYQGVPPADLIDWDPLDLYGAALAHLRFGQQRSPGEARGRVYNPQIERHGWQSTHTIVEVVNDDMPFLVDSVSMALNRQGLLIHLTIHPVVPVRRAADGAIETVLEAPPGNGGDIVLESFMHFEIDRQSDLERLEAMRADIERALGDVCAAVEDWRTMLGKIPLALEDLGHGAKVIDADDLEEAKAFLAWIADNHFTFLGYGCYDLIRDKGGDQLHRVDGSALGLLRRQESASTASRSFAALPPEVRRHAREPVPLVITKANARSTVHRPVYLDYIGVKRFDPKGKVVGEHRFLGLFTSAAYNRNPRQIPLLRHKVAEVIERANLPPGGHSGKALANILETYPRDELLQTDEDELFRVAQEILHLQERQKIRLFLRRDPFARFVSCLVYVPRERYNTEIRRRFQEILQEALGGTEVEFQAQVSESILARIQFIIRTPDGIPADVERGEIEARLVEAARSWNDVLRDGLIDAHGEEDGNRLFRAWGDAIPVAYQDQVPARAAVPDVDRIDQLARGEIELAMSLSRPLELEGSLLCLRLVRKDQAIPLSDVLPVLEDMGLRVLHEQPYEVVTDRAGRFWIHDFRVQPVEAMALPIEQVRDAFQEAFARVWHGQVENDGFNQLVLHGLDWRQILVLRTYCKYLLQVGIPFSQAYMEQTLAHNPGLARQAALLFEAKFDPDAEGDRQAKLADLEARYRADLDAVANLDEDRILRRYMRLILATLRTNYYQRGPDGAAHNAHLSIKIDPAAVPEMPLPLPAYEIFVYSPRTEGVHLRGGKVARGGIRWSDRREDFRTEVLGLM